MGAIKCEFFKMNIQNYQRYQNSAFSGRDWSLVVYVFSSVQSLSRVWLFATPWTAPTRPPCPSPTPGACSNSCPSSRWCHPTISSSVVPFSSCLQSFPASWSFPMSQFFASGGQNIGVSPSASALPIYIQDCFPLGWTGWNSLWSKDMYYLLEIFTLEKCVNYFSQLKWYLMQ